MIQVIPAIDIIEGKCVRLSKGDFNSKKVYNEDPVEVAQQFEDAGISRLHVVDLDGAKTGTVNNLKVLEAIANSTKLIIDFGGGINKTDDVNSAFNAGASMISIGSVAVKKKDLLLEWVKHFGAAKFLLGADVMNNNIVIKGWTEATTIDVHDFITRYTQEGITNIFCTDVSKDGMLEGTSMDLYKDIISRNKLVHLIASGGVTSLQDVEQLNAIGCTGVIIGKAIYEGFITLEELKHYAN
jgi:phosphoribosylformimino-5-aminoimidazole carboxamide ribotide isomerase